MISNYKGEKFPDNLTSLLLESERMAAEIKNNLINAPTLGELYHYDDTSKKVFRQKEKFPPLICNSKLSSKHKSDNEIMGLYIFGEPIDNTVEPVYVGITRTIYRRLKQHGWGKWHNQCTLAYIMANKHYHNNEFDKSRKDLPERELDDMKKKLRKHHVMIIPVDLDYELYFLEVALAGLLETKWNSFRTH